jgi:hypothetical protein
MFNEYVFEQVDTYFDILDVKILENNIISANFEDRETIYYRYEINNDIKTHMITLEPSFIEERYGEIDEDESYEREYSDFICRFYDIKTNDLIGGIFSFPSESNELLVYKAKYLEIGPIISTITDNYDLQHFYHHNDECYNENNPIHVSLFKDK